MLAIADQIRDESRSVIEALHDNEIQHTVMLTGDAEQTRKSNCTTTCNQ